MFDLLPGQFTDDTSMALCLAESLRHGFDLHDQILRYVKWQEEGYLSSTGECFDIGNATWEALERFKATGNPTAGSLSPDSAGNGSIMRLAPVPIRFLDAPQLAIELCAEQSRTTHQSPECLMACRLLGDVLIRALQGKSKDKILAPSQQVIKWSSGLKAISEGSYKLKNVNEIIGSGYVVESLEAALFCFWKTSNYRECVLMAANLGFDSDTTAAIAGQLAGATYLEAGIPIEWLNKLTRRYEIGETAEALSEADNETKSAQAHPY